MTEYKVLVFGSDTMQGKSLKKILDNYIYNNLNVGNYKFIFYKGSDLVINELDKFFEKHSFDGLKTIVINLLSYRGGIMKNLNDTADMYIQNQELNHNILSSCYKNGIFKLINILSTCMFGDDAGFPVKEEYIDEGVPHYSNLGFAQANKNAYLLSTLINLDNYYKYVNLIATDIYGEFDNYDTKTGSVIPSIIHKAYLAIKNGETDLHLLGDGNVERMYLYVDDLSKVILDFIFTFDEKGCFIISGSLKKKILISDLAEIIIEKIIENGYSDDINISFNMKKELNGQLKRNCNNSNLKKLYADYDIEFPIIDNLDSNIDKIVVWFWNNYHNYTNK